MLLRSAKHPWRDSNSRFRLRRPTLYPLSYRGTRPYSNIAAAVVLSHLAAQFRKLSAKGVDERGISLLITQSHKLLLLVGQLAA